MAPKIAKIFDDIHEKSQVTEALGNRIKLAHVMESLFRS